MKMLERKGFTIVETMIVIAIIGILSAATLLAVRLPLQRARFEHDVEIIKSLDAQARALSARGKHAELRFDTTPNTVSLSYSGQSQKIRLSGVHQIARFVCDDAINHADGRMTVEYGAGGTSTSYALRLQQNTNQSQWLVFMGLSGQSYLFSSKEWDDARVAALFAARLDSR